MQPSEAHRIVARQVLANHADDYGWEELPDIGEGDFLNVLDEMQKIAPSQKQFAEAIHLLEQRAEAWHKEHPDEMEY